MAKASKTPSPYIMVKASPEIRAMLQALVDKATELEEEPSNGSIVIRDLIRVAYRRMKKAGEGAQR